MRIAVAAGPGDTGLLMELGEDGAPRSGAVTARDLAAAVAERERARDVRWVWADTAAVYPALLRGGVRVRRCHDVALAERLLLSREQREREPASLGAAWARLRGAAPAPAPPAVNRGGPPGQEALFQPANPDLPGPREALEALAAVHADQARRIAADARPGRFAMLAAVESAGGLAAAEMSFDGLPWRVDAHEALLAGLLGPRPAPGSRPARLADLAARISAAFGGRPVNPDSPSQVLRALAADGVRAPSTRSAALRQVRHPAAPLLLEYKELARLHAAHGWAWLDAWVSGGRFRPQYVVGGVVSGRWATRGGGALQIPRVLRRAVVADPGWALVVADAAQLEPRVLAALAGDGAFAEAAGAGDLYEALAGAFGGDRAAAKVALLSAMYGGAGGEAGQLLAVLRRRFPLAASYVEAAAREGEEGRVVRSRLGRTCPPPSRAWRGLTADSGGPHAGLAGQSLRARGRFTRNFVVQASAADWAMTLLAGLRLRLAEMEKGGAGVAAPAGPHLVFFQHDEVIVHCPQARAADVAAAVHDAARQAGRLVFGDTPVRFPMSAAVVSCYADAKQPTSRPDNAVPGVGSVAAAPVSPSPRGRGGAA